MRRIQNRWLAVAVLLATSLGGPEPGRAQQSAPTAAASAAATSEQSSALAALVSWVKKERGSLSVSVIDLPSGTRLLGHQPEVPGNPASNMKVITAAAALDLLGPEYRFRTGVYGRMNRDGVASRLVLRGDGDPSLRSADIWRLSASLVARGLERVDGPILVDQSRFDGKFVPPAFGQQPDEWAAFRAPVSAIALDRNAVTLNVLPTRAGEPAKVWFEPPGFVNLSGRVTTRKSGKGQDVRLVLAGGRGTLTAQLAGGAAEGLPRLRFQRRVDDPRLMVGFVFRHALRSLGVKISGGVEAGGAKVKRRLLYVGSDPLAELVRELGKNSDNFYAEMLLIALASKAAPGQPASSEAGAKVLLDWLARTGVATEKLRIENGSGLFDANRLSAASITGTLRHAYRSPRIGPDFVPQLAIGGVDGTLRSRFRKHRKSRAIRAKTGTLAKTNALSGYVLRPGRSPLAFSVLVNGIGGKHSQIRKRVDRFVSSLTR